MLLDTDVLIEISRGRPEAIPFLEKLESPVLRIPGVVAMEFLIGSRNKIDLVRAQKVLSRCEVVTPNASDTQLAIQLVESFALTTGMSLPDYVIAAQAINAAETLFSFNLKHFSVLPNLDVQVPYLR
jgi:predicted nucleic acid-binding protein